MHYMDSNHCQSVNHCNRIWMGRQNWQFIDIGQQQRCLEDNYQCQMIQIHLILNKYISSEFIKIKYFIILQNKKKVNNQQLLSNQISQWASTNNQMIITIGNLSVILSLFCFLFSYLLIYQLFNLKIYKLRHIKIYNSYFLKIINTQTSDIMIKQALILFLFVFPAFTIQHVQQQIPSIGLSIVFIFGGLILGGLLKVFSRISQIPYNPLLLLTGLCLGYYHVHLNFLGEAAILVSQLNPNGIIAIFLPALIFQSAFKTQWHMFKKQSGQTLLLGIPCVLLGAVFIMISIKLIMSYQQKQFSWTEALLCASILSCTDIFSFVHRLKKHGTPQKIISLIEGESLMNYCTCVLVFQIINEIIMDFDSTSTLYLVQLLIEETLGGVMFGLLFAFFAVLCLKRIVYDGVLVVTIMVIFCYSIYLIAQFSVLRVSGIISIVVYALYMNVFGKTIIPVEVFKYVDTFWTYIVFVAQTSIFLIAGVNVGVHVLSFENLISDNEYFILLEVYLICLASRFISIAAFMSWLKDFGYGMNFKQAFFIAYAGLKGAVGISLAMLIYQNKHYSSTIGHLILFFVAGNSILTLLINGTTAGLIIKILGLSTLTKVQYKFFKQFLIQFQNDTLDKKEELKYQKYLDMVNWDQIDMQIGIPNYKKMRQQIDKTMQKCTSKQSKFQKRQLYKLQQVLKEFSNKNNPINNLAEDEFNSQNYKFDLIVELRKRFIKNCISKYWQYHEDSYISPGALLLLLQSAYFDLDTQTEELQSWVWIKSQISYNIKFLSQLMKISILNQMAKSYLFQYISYCYDIVSSYIQANQSVRQEFKSFTILNHQKGMLEIVLNQSIQNQKEAESFLKNYLQPSFPQIQKEVITRKSSYHVLSYFKNIINRYYQTGQLQINQYQFLKNLIQKKALQLDLSSPQWQKTDFLDLLKKDQIFATLPQIVLKVLANQLSVQQTFDVNEKIINNSQIAKHVYFIKKGGCEVEFINEKAIYKDTFLAGYMLGFEGLLSNTYRSAATANTMVTAICVKKNCIQKIMDSFPQFEELFWKKNIFKLYKMFTFTLDISFHLSHLKRSTIQELIYHFSMQTFQVGRYSVTQDMIFIRGQVQILQSEEIYEQCQPMMFLSKKQQIQFQVKKTSKFLIGEIDYETIQKANRLYSSFGHNSRVVRRRLDTDSQVKTPLLIKKITPIPQFQDHY